MSSHNISNTSEPADAMKLLYCSIPLYYACILLNWALLTEYTQEYLFYANRFV